MVTAEQLLTLAESLKEVLRPNQLERIQQIAGKVSGEQRDKLFAKLQELEKVHIEAMKHELEVRQRMNAEFKAYQAKQKTEALKEEESKDRAEADAEADRLLDELNQL